MALFSHQENLDQLEPAILLLIQSVKDNMSDQLSRQFAEQLMRITLDHLYGLLRDALDVMKRTKDDPLKEKEDLTTISGRLMGLIAELREIVKCWMQKPELSVSDIDTADGILDETLSKWGSMNTQVCFMHHAC